MRVMIIVFVLLLTACSSASPTPSTNPSGSVSGRVSAKPTLSLDEQVQRTLLSEDAVASAEFERDDPSRFDENETDKFDLTPGCEPPVGGNPRIDREWQVSFSHPGTYVDAHHVSVHYTSGADAAVAKIDRAPVCHPRGVGVSKFATGPDAAGGATTSCGLSAYNGDLVCRILAHSKNFASAIVLFGRSDLVDDAVKTLAPLLVRAVSGQAAGSSSSPTSSPSSSVPSVSLAPTGTWDPAYARERFTSMSSIRSTDYCTSTWNRVLAGGYPGAAEAAPYYARDCASDSKIFRENLSFGHWPASARSEISALRAKLAVEPAAFLRVANARSLAQLKRRIVAAEKLIDQTDRAISTALAALG